MHASQIGYCPGDAYKRAYLSIWLGADANGQGLDIDYKIDSFHLVEKTTGKTVYTGKAVQTKKKGDIDSMGGTAQCPDLDLCKSAVFRLDFSDFQRPGEYCVCAGNRSQSPYPPCVQRMGATFPGCVAFDTLPAQWDRTQGADTVNGIAPATSAKRMARSSIRLRLQRMPDRKAPVARTC